MDDRYPYTTGPFEAFPHASTSHGGVDDMILNGWSGLDPAPTATPEDIDSRAALDLAYAHCFTTRDGRRVLDHLRECVLLRALGPDASDAEIRHREGQRQLILAIESFVARGKSEPGR